MDQAKQGVAGAQTHGVGRHEQVVMQVWGAAVT